MTMIRSAAVSRRAIEPSSGPGLLTAAHSCAPAHPPSASGQAAPPSPPPPTHHAPRTPHPSLFFSRRAPGPTEAAGS